MKESKPKYFQRVTVTFGPDEEKTFLSKYRGWRCLDTQSRPDLLPWGTQSATMERKTLAPR